MHTLRGAHHYYRTLKAAFNKAVDWEYIEANHFIKVKLSKKQWVMPAYIDIYQLAVIISQLEEGIVRDVITFAFYTGMRLSEIVNLRWRNVDLEEKVIAVGDEEFETKSRMQRIIPMCGEVFELLRKIQLSSAIERNSYVFGKNNGVPFTGDYFSRRFKRACRAAAQDPLSNISNEIHFHSLRHSFASHLVQQGVSLYVIKELLGHSSISTTEIYSHLNMESLRGR